MNITSLTKCREGDPAVETGLDVEWFEENCPGHAALYQNIYLSDRLFLRLTVVSKQGVCVIVPFEEKADATAGSEIRRLLGVDAVNSMILFHSRENSLILSDDGNRLLPVTDIYGLFHSRFSGEADRKAAILDSESAFRLREMLAALENGERPAPDAEEAVDDEGRRYVRRHVPVSVAGIDTGLGGKTQWYPVADDDTDRLVTMAAFGGWFGLHRFSQGEIATGLLYLLSCGCVGILPALDIILYLTGSMYINSYEYVVEDALTRVRMREFLRKPVYTWWAVVCIFLAVGTGILAWHFLYRGALPGVLQWIFSAVKESVPAERLTDGISTGKVLCPQGLIP